MIQRAVFFKILPVILQTEIRKKYVLTVKQFNHDYLKFF